MIHVMGAFWLVGLVVFEYQVQKQVNISHGDLQGRALLNAIGTWPQVGFG